jgi:hypothetical protein
VKSLDDGLAKADRPGQAGAEEFEDFPLPPPLKSSNDSSIKVRRDDEAGTDEYAGAPPPPRAETADDTSIQALRDDQTHAAELDPSLPPREKNSDRVTKFLNNDKIVIEELEREHKFKMALGLSKQANRPKYSDDEYISTKTIIRIAAAVIVLGLAFTAILPSLLTRNPVESTVELVTSPSTAPPAQTEQRSVAQPIPGPRPAQAPRAAPAAPASNASVAKTAPALRGSAPTDVPADDRAKEQVLLPSAGKAAGRTALTAAEAAAVNRGLEALQKSAATKEPPSPVTNAPPPRAASGRPALTAEEQAAVERGLRELEKTAQTKQ